MRLRDYVVLFALALIWGASFLFIKVAIQDVTPAMLVAGRLLFSIATLSLIVAARPSLFAGWRRYWRLAVLAGLVNIALPFLLISWGETRIASGVASILNATTPLFTVILASWWPGNGHEALSGSRVAGVLLGFIGVGVLIGPGALSFAGAGLGSTIGELAVLVAAAAYGVGALLARGFAGSGQLVGPLTMQVAALVYTLPVVVLTGVPTHVPSPRAFAMMAVLGVLGTAVAYLLYFSLIRNVGASRTTIVTYLLPCTALIWGVTLLGETVSWNTLAGLLLVLLGTVVTNGTLRGSRRGRQLSPAPVGQPLPAERAEAARR
jgi:drug/metabolite transporter (DMT)-like permease